MSDEQELLMLCLVTWVVGFLLSMLLGYLIGRELRIPACSNTVKSEEGMA